MFQVPASKSGQKANRFAFKIGDESFDVPKMEFLTGEQIDLICQGDLRGGIHDVAAKYAIFGAADTPVGRAVRTLDQPQLEALLTQYQIESGITVGESAASTDS